MKLVLASNSPRRIELVKLGGWEHKNIPANIDETPLNGESPKDYTIRISRNKALEVANLIDKSSIVVGADTIVVHEERILGKPKDNKEARAMLESLRGNIHQVNTAITVLDSARKTKIVIDFAVTEVPMRLFTDDEMHAYIESGDPFDKAGSYAIQHQGFNPVRKITGCYANVVGLPLCHLVRTLDKFDFHTKNDLPQACQDFLNYDCPVYSQVLRGEL